MRKSRFLLAPIAAAVLAACAVGPNYHAPETKAAEKFDSLEATYSTGQGTRAFWQTFADSGTRQARERRAGIEPRPAHRPDAREGSTRTATRCRLRSRAEHQCRRRLHQDAHFERRASLPGAARDAELYDAGFDAFWELDFFGGVRRGLEASKADLGAEEAALQDVQVIVTGEVTRTYFELRGQQLQLDVARRNVANQQSTLELAQVRLDAGSGTEFDTARAQAQLSTTLGTIGPLEAAVARSIHRLSVLVGREPGALRAELTPTAEPATAAGHRARGRSGQPVASPAGYPRRRARAGGRHRAIGVAVADLFPRVTFTGSAGYVAGSSGALGDGGTDAYVLAPGISWGIFDYGHVQARIGAAKWRKEGALLRYEKTVLQALEETEDSLVTHARARDRLVHDEAAVQASNTAAGLARVRYENGASDFLQVLDAERTLLQSEDQLARSRTEAATSLIAVYKALGGGWEGAPHPN